MAPPGGAEDAPRGAKRGPTELGDNLPEEISEQQIQTMLDKADEVHIETLNDAALKRMVLQLERKIKRNQELRIKHADDPSEYMKTEVDLDEEVKRFTQLSTHPDLFGDFIKLGAMPLIVGLLNHVNTDIACDVFEVMSELTEPEVVAESDAGEAFIAALYDAQVCEMSVDTLMRIDESASEEDAKAVTNCLTMMENLADINPTEACVQFVKVPRLLPWLIKRVRAPGEMDYNRVYASEILGIVLQNSAASREVMVKHEGVDKLLRGIAGYRKRDPADSEESEYVQNMFDCLCSLMLLPAHQVTFGKLQGLELMIRMMRERKFAANLALRLAAHSVRHCATNCDIIVEKLGLKVLFSMFMKKGPQAKTRSAARESEEHVTSIVASLCRYCTGMSVARTLNKFVENRFEKLERLLEMHEEYARSVREADERRLRGEAQQIDRELEVDDDEQLFLDRCDAGLFTLQQVDTIIVRLANMGNSQATDEICKLLESKGVPFAEIAATIAEFCEHLDPSAADERRELYGFVAALGKRCGVNVELPDDLVAEAPKSAARAVEPELEERRQAAEGSSEGEKSSSEDEKRQRRRKHDRDKKDEKRDKERKDEQRITLSERRAGSKEDKERRDDARTGDKSEDRKENRRDATRTEKKDDRRDEKREDVGKTTGDSKEERRGSPHKKARKEDRGR